ncbi:Hypothetical predicted protein [Pelobates cultripes]|uniref:Uncharacterized protein n=1 Tax=Pelobates cultripes TaxID=61616 RepID=A0AAD1SPY3_PELCU|nr:Hypothetical predicted protein [Pelobates cultripes]
MSNRRPSKKHLKEAPSVADMLTSQRPTPRGVPAATSPTGPEQPNPPKSKDPPMEASSTAILHSLAEVKGYLAGEIKRTAAEVKAEIAARGARTAIIEQRMETVVTAHNSASALTNTLLHKITDLELELEDVSNRSRRNNMRIRGLPESLYQDIAPATLLRRREWKPVTDLLHARFAWGYPFKILVFNGPKPAILQPSSDIVAFLKGLDIDVPEDFPLPATAPASLPMIPADSNAM